MVLLMDFLGGLYKCFVLFVEFWCVGLGFIFFGCGWVVEYVEGMVMYLVYYCGVDGVGNGGELFEWWVGLLGLMYDGIGDYIGCLIWC